MDKRSLLELGKLVLDWYLKTLDSNNSNSGNKK